jgi:peptidoglycan hydrolase CwlO-like protein
MDYFTNYPNGLLSLLAIPHAWNNQSQAQNSVNPLAKKIEEMQNQIDSNKEEPKIIKKFSFKF